MPKDSCYKSVKFRASAREVGLPCRNCRSQSQLSPITRGRGRSDLSVRSSLTLGGTVMEAKTCVSKSEKESGINAKLFDARNQCSPIDCHSHRSTVCASNPTFCLAQDAHDLLPLGLVMLSGCPFCVSRIDFADRFSHNPGNLLLHAVVVRNGGLHSRCAQFWDRHLKRFAARQDHGTLDDIFQFPNVSRPIPIRQGLHCSGRNRFDVFLHSPCELLDEEAYQKGNIFFPLT